MEEAQRGLEVGDACVAGRDDRDAATMLVLQRGDQQRACFDGRAGDVEAAVPIEELSEKRGLCDARAKIGNQRIVAVHSRAKSKGSPLSPLTWGEGTGCRKRERCAN